MKILCHPDDAELIRTALAGQDVLLATSEKMERGEYRVLTSEPLDFFPVPPVIQEIRDAEAVRLTDVIRAEACRRLILMPPHFDFPADKINL